MDLEQLNKTQIVLLTLLVSFMTSIATGIVTVTLVEQAPTEVTRTIHQVVEKTVETVIPGETKTIETVKEVEVKVGATQSEKVIEVIGKNKEAIVGISDEEGSFYQAGFFIDGNGTILTSSENMFFDFDYQIHWLDDELEVSEDTVASLVASPVVINEESGFAKLELVDPEDTEGSLSPFAILSSILERDSFPHVVMTKNDFPTHGESLISLGSSKNAGLTTVNTNVFSLRKETNASSTPFIRLHPSPEDSFIGGPVFDLSGDIVGLYVDMWLDLDSMIVPTSELLPIEVAAVEESDNVASVIEATQ